MDASPRVFVDHRRVDAGKAHRPLGQASRFSCVQRQPSGEDRVMPAMLELPLYSFLALVAVMSAAWWTQRRTLNAGVVDVIWTASIGLLAVLYVALEDGWGPRRVLVGALAGAWSLRLTLHLAHRVGSEAEDGRYRALREELGERFDRWLFWFFQAQALLAVLLSLVFLVLAGAEQVGWRLVDGLAVLLWVASIAGETIADRQLASWRADPEHRGKTCRAGLWRYSRHPNYFFEWIHWLVYPVLGIGLPFGWALWLAPAVMLFLVLKVTGVPPTEAQAVKSRGDDYRHYQRTVNAFFPGPPRLESQTDNRSLFEGSAELR
jgi:steroid 5-alpha reductase family enzyme